MDPEDRAKHEIDPTIYDAYREVFTVADVTSSSVEDIYARLLRKGNGGTTVRTTSAPALSTQFVRSDFKHKATARYQGSFAEIIYPSDADVEKKRWGKHMDHVEYGYRSCKASDAYPAGYGERSAKALTREENIYQLKGTFPSAALNFAKLRASVSARGGDVSSVETIFAEMWGISAEEVDMMPKLHIDGSEATRLSAMDDRAYHALSGHPGHHGGYRVDMATVAPDMIGENVPLNWPRLRTGFKAVALLQIQGDAYVADLIRRTQKNGETRMTMDIVKGSQPIYVRPKPWEVYLSHLIKPSEEVQRRIDGTLTAAEFGMAVMVTPADESMKVFFDQEGSELGLELQKVAKTVSHITTSALSKTVSIILDYSEARAEIEEFQEDDYDELDTSTMSMNIEVPRYKLTRKTLYRGLKKELLGRDDLPDIASHGKAKLQLDLSEFREARLNIPLDIPGALNLAVYLAVMNPSVQMSAYSLMLRVPAPQDGTGRKVAIRLRNQELYNDPSVRALGSQLFGDVFMNAFELLLRNMTSRSQNSDSAVKQTIWEYLSSRCRIKRDCYVIGGWKDLIMELRSCAEGWGLYYWARVTIGRKHHAVSDGILAPMAAGSSLDFLSLMKRTIQVKAQSWASYYSGAYKVIEGTLTEDREKRKQLREKRRKQVEEGRPISYIPPQLRHFVDLENEYDADAILNRGSGYTAEQYQRMVEMQSKSKFFSNLDVFTHGSQLAVGITDDKMLAMLVEFYQARWYSLHTRIMKAKKKGKVFTLGVHEFPEHPWGELATTFPSTSEGMIEYMGGLDFRAWTIQPDFLQTKLRKSLSELWEDISREVSKLTLYIREVCEGLADEQDEVDAEEGIKTTMVALLGTEAIPIPAFGYRAPFAGPQKSITVVTDEGECSKDTRGLAFVSEEAQLSDDEEPDLEMVDDLEDSMDFEAMMTSLANIPLGGKLERIPVDYISLRRIWHILGLPTESDERMRVGLGVAWNHDLDMPHMDDGIGPIIIVGEENMIQRRWKRKEPMIAHRLGIMDSKGHDDDM